jgi:hypothetical protein
MEKEQEELLCPFCGEKINEGILEKSEEIPLEQYENLGQG